MSEKRKNSCQNPYNVCYDNYLNTNACTECTGLISTPAKDNDEWENYRNNAQTNDLSEVLSLL